MTKGLSLKPRAGNPTPRIVETPGGMLNAVGLQNVGADAFAREKWPALRALKLPVILSIAGFSDAEFVERFDRHRGGVDARRVLRRAANLEDVFIKLTGRDIRD